MESRRKLTIKEGRHMIKAYLNPQFTAEPPEGHALRDALWVYREGKLVQFPSLLEALNIEKSTAPVLSFTGAGGKTTLITRMAGEYLRRGTRVVVTTTTHMMAWDYPWFLLEPSAEKMERILADEGMVWLGLPAGDGKMQAPPRGFLQQVLKKGYPLLIEADGAKRFPVKAPASHEPVLLPETTHVINVCGLDSLGKPMEEVCFRPEIAAGLLHKQKTDPVTQEDIVDLALDSRAGKKHVMPQMSYHLVLNKADGAKEEAQALEICRLAEKRGFAQITVTAGGRQIQR